MQLQVNLLPKGNRPKPSVRFWPILLTIVFTLNIVGMGSWLMFLQLDLSASQTNLTLLNNEVAKLEHKVEMAEAAAVLENEISVKREFISSSISESRYWHPLLEAIESAMVPGANLTVFAASESGDVTIGGETDTVKSVAELLGSLQVATGLPVIRVGSVIPEGTFQLTLRDWSGREVPEGE